MTANVGARVGAAAATFVLLAAIASVALRGCPRRSARSVARSGDDAPPRCALFAQRNDTLTYNIDPERRGWNAAEPRLSPARVASPAFGRLWSSAELDTERVGEQTYAPHLYATPLYADNVVVSAGPYAGRTLSVVIAGTTNGWVYAINAFSTSSVATSTSCGGPEVPAGAIVWRTRLAPPQFLKGFDGGMPLGVLSTPTIDRRSDPPRLYVTALNAEQGWQAFALDLRSGQVLPGWPLTLRDDTLSSVNRNAPARFGKTSSSTQRAGVALSRDGGMLYLGFSSSEWVATGWMVAIDTRAPRILSAFATARSGDGNGRGGIWATGGAALDASGQLFVTTGNGLERMGPTPGYWGNSLLRFGRDLTLSGTYSPFAYCTLDEHDMDIGSSSPMLFDLEPSATSTPHLMTFGSKQGNVYLLDRDHLPGALDRRPPCERGPAEDGSLLPPGPQPQYGTRGPLHLFGPFTSTQAKVDFARMHTALALFRDAQGKTLLFASGASKVSDTDSTSLPPGLYRLRVASAPGAPASLEVDGVESTTRLWNPGSPLVTSDGANGAVVWVLDSNQARAARLVGPTVAHPVLYAFDAATLRVLFRTAPDELAIGGKYSSATVAHGVVFVGTDRIQAFGLRDAAAP